MRTLVYIFCLYFLTLPILNIFINSNIVASNMVTFRIMGTEVI